MPWAWAASGDAICDMSSGVTRRRRARKVNRSPPWDRNAAYDLARRETPVARVANLGARRQREIHLPLTLEVAIERGFFLKAAGGNADGQYDDDVHVRPRATDLYKIFATAPRPNSTGCTCRQAALVLDAPQ